MFPFLQPQRPKPPQQPSRPQYPHQQIRAAHPATSTPLSTAPPMSASSPLKPRSQVEAMPPFTAPLAMPRNLYDSAVRHPVFFTEQLRKPPFPIPVAATQGWNPAASGYILEQRRAEAGENAVPRTKL
ncbi:hypothetical protein N0V90_006966 [Kalmusia sp. IMI 367209]|nr:hypothetical protein N0V90_006966 [Kalmusia sp. IMI 367209]